MDCGKVGKFILEQRKEKGLTQKELADAMGLSDRTISKWERGAGCPDVSLLRELAEFFGVSIKNLLQGDLEPNPIDGGNMKRIKFYLCPTCGNVLFGTGEAEISCCGRRLTPLAVQQATPDHHIQVQEVDNDYDVTIEHEMNKQHYITFVAYVCYDRVLLVKLYPEQAAEVRVPKRGKGELYACCNRHGLWKLNK